MILKIFRTFSVAVILTALLFQTAQISAQTATAPTQTAWFGAATPAQRQDKRNERLKNVDVDLGAKMLTSKLSAKDDPYQDIRGDEGIKFVKDIVAFSEQSRDDGNLLWGRLSGSKYELMAAEYVERKFNEFGLTETRIETFPRTPQWMPTEFAVTMVGDSAFGAGTLDYRLTSAFPTDSAATGKDEIEAEMVYVGLAKPSDLVGRNLTGKIAVVNSQLQISSFFHTAVGVTASLAAAGVVGVVIIMDVPGPVQFEPFGIGSPKVPVFTIDGDDGAFVVDVIGKAGTANRPKLRLKLGIEQIEGWKAQNVFGMIKGETDENIVLTAHLDAYFYGASDNATGIATMLSLAKHFSRTGAKRPKRTMIFIATSGHHAKPAAGGYSAGATDVLEKHSELFKKTVFVFNCEHVASINTYVNLNGLVESNTETPLLVIVSNKSSRLYQFLNEAIDRYGIPVTTRTNQLPIGDPLPFYYAGITVVHFIAGGLWYHTTRDTPESISISGLERIGRASAYFLDKVDGTSRADIDKDAVPRPK